MSIHKKLNKKDEQVLKQSLKNATVEKDVENAYRSILDTAYIKDGYGTVSSPYQCDGFYTSGMFLRLLLEAKHQLDLLDKRFQCETLIQALYYIKKFEKNGRELPNVIFVGDVNECFIVSGSKLEKYLKENLDWSIAPNKAASKNMDLVVRMIDDKGICPFIFNTEAVDFKFDDVCEAIDRLVENGETIKVELTETNIRTIYESFLRTIFPKNEAKKQNLDPAELVSIFIQSMIGDVNCYLHPKINNVLHTSTGKDIKINKTAYYAFFARYRQGYTPKECKKFTEIADRLIEETKRRFSGDFWTPTIWTKHAYNYLDKCLGKNWHNDFVVWDSSCGTKNLTRDRKFNRLYLSTLHKSELQLSNTYNTEAISTFQYDFLNDDISITPLFNYQDINLKMPQDLFNDLKSNKPFLFIGNPPYGTANNAGANGTHKAGIAQNEINKEMKQNHFGKCSQQLYAQFFYRIFKLKKDFNLSRVVIAFFTKSSFLVSETFEVFRNILFKNFGFLNGFLFQASEFSDVSNTWGVSFTIWDSAKSNINLDKWNLDICECKKDGINTNGTKTLRSVPSHLQCSKWIREPVLNLPIKKDDYPQLSSGMKVTSAQGKSRGTLLSGAFAYNVNCGNDVYNSGRDVFFLSSAAYKGNGVSICKENFERCCANFTARQLVEKSWVNDKDQFQVPVTTKDGWKSWLLDAIVFSIFHNQNQCCSMKNFEYKNKTYRVENGFFWISKDFVSNLSNKYSFNEIYNDTQTDSERFVYTYLNNHKSELSPESVNLLSSAKSFITSSFKERKNYSILNPHDHLVCWDAGWHQLKKLKDFAPSQFIEFQSKFKILSDKLKPGIYDFGFLER